MPHHPLGGSRPSRRRFVRNTLLTGAAVIAPVGFVRGADEPPAPADKLSIAIIGAGGRGAGNLNDVASQDICALCDVNTQVTDKLKQRFPDARAVTDWRTLADDTSIDAFVISTADHHHAPAALAAMRAGKHVFCEKPLAHTVREARLMQDVYLAHRDKIATQMGTQIHATENYRRVVELVQAGAVGPVREAHVWCSRGINAVNPVVLPEQPKPEWFDWDSWLGPADDRPYNAGYWQGGNLNWNRRWEFGNGVLGDMGSHLIDLAFWALDLKRPTAVESVGPEPDPIAAPPWQIVTWDHAARDGDAPHHAALKLIWYHGGEGMKRRSDALQPKIGGDADLTKWGIGVAFIGDDGILVADYDKLVLSPAAKFADYQRPEPSIAKSLGHHAEWLHAAKTGAPTLCNFDYSGALIEHNLLGNVAHRAGKKLDWDAASLSITNAPDAAALLTKSYRTGWKPEGV